jgi:hydrogenase maturation protease
MCPTKPVPLLVLGLGNRICGDDGIGIDAVELLSRRYLPPPGALVLDGGTLGLSLLPYLQDSRDVILLDAVRADAPPGTFVRIPGPEVPAVVQQRLSPHQIGVADLMAGAELLGAPPERLLLLGLVPKTIGLGLERTPEVERGVPGLVERAVEEARNWGYEFIEKFHVEEIGARRDGTLAARSRV